jgi:hypothetical protein
MSYREDNALMGLAFVGLAAAGYGTYLAALWLWKYSYCLFAGF